MTARRIPQWLREAREQARTTACCPRCQVTPGVPCHTDGIPLPDGQVHARRYQEAEETAA